jgi:PPOX class probable F420-dependent enzyme
MPDALDPLRPTKTILLTTYRRDGMPASTPVSIAFHGDRAFFRTYDRAAKAKRLRNNPHVEAAPATLRGEPTGTPIRARARLLSGDDARVAAAALARRHRLLQRIVVPLSHRLARSITSSSQRQPQRHALSRAAAPGTRRRSSGRA